MPFLPFTCDKIEEGSWRRAHKTKASSFHPSVLHGQAGSNSISYTDICPDSHSLEKQSHLDHYGVSFQNPPQFCFAKTHNFTILRMLGFKTSELP